MAFCSAVETLTFLPILGPSCQALKARPSVPVKSVESSSGIPGGRSSLVIFCTQASVDVA